VPRGEGVAELEADRSVKRLQAGLRGDSRHRVTRAGRSEGFLPTGQKLTVRRDEMAMCDTLRTPSTASHGCSQRWIATTSVRGSHISTAAISFGITEWSCRKTMAGSQCDRK
jgi:hypothetical protein